MYISFLSPTEIFSYHSVQFSSVAQSCLTLCALIIHFSDYITLIDINNRVLDYPSNNGHFKLFKIYTSIIVPCHAFPFLWILLKLPQCLAIHSWPSFLIFIHL